MVVRSIVPTLNEVLGAPTIAHNCSIFRGEGELGEEFTRAIRTSAPYAGVYYVEALVNTTTGRIDEILQPDPKRVYEQETMDQDGNLQMVAVSLSSRFPTHRLGVFILDARGQNELLDVIARDEISPQARACLRQSIVETRTAASVQHKAA